MGVEQIQGNEERRVRGRVCGSPADAGLLCYRGVNSSFSSLHFGESVIEQIRTEVHNVKGSFLYTINSNRS